MKGGEGEEGATEAVAVAASGAGAAEGGGGAEEGDVIF